MDTLGPIQIQVVCPLYRGCPSLRGSNQIGRIKLGDLNVERYLIQCPFIGGSSLRGSTVLF